MGYIAEQNAVHSDLSTRNVLLDEKMFCKMAKFAKFGFARKLDLYKHRKQGNKGLLGNGWHLNTLTERNLQFIKTLRVWI